MGSHVQVFDDPGGRRRRTVRLIVCLTAVMILLAAAFAVPSAFRSTAVADVGPGRALDKYDLGEDVPILGRGPLERVVELRRDAAAYSAIEPFTRADLGRLEGVTDAQVAGHSYAIQRYGYSASAHKTIALTFDDGPDPKITPKLLDVLAKHRVPATFFVVGRNAVRAPEVVERMEREGHAVAGHTMTHPVIADLPTWRAQAEVVGTARVLRDLTHRDVSYWRMPYTAAEPDLQRRTVDGLLRAQRLGYTHASYDFDTQDWMHDADPDGTAADIPLPAFDQDNYTILLHDAGGPGRQRTVEYVDRLITTAKSQGYTFHTMPQVVPALQPSTTHITPSTEDGLVRDWATATQVWPSAVLTGLFVFALLCCVLLGLVNAVLAVVRHRRRSRIVWPDPSEVDLSTSVVLAAYNEEVVIERTLRSILDSDHVVDEIVVVDDGSTDATREIAARIAAEDPRIRVLTQENAGKSAALNHGLTVARGDVVVTLDADTVLEPRTIGCLVRHFWADDHRPEGAPQTKPLGAVAGAVRVGNRSTNLLTKWQALEYVTQIGLDRTAQDAMGAISIVPGACAAWRREAIRQVGGYSTDTLAEDCDLALSLHEAGWRITQDDDAVAWTEAPDTVDDLLKQRSRWTFGTLQATYKHRRLLFRRGSGLLGWLVLPNYLASIVVPIVFLPFIAYMTYVALQQGGGLILVGYFVLFLLVHLALAALTIRLMGESLSHLKYVPLYRIVNEPLRAYLLYSSVHLAIVGGRMSWQKFDRTGTVETEAATREPTSRPSATAARSGGVLEVDRVVHDHGRSLTGRSSS